MASRREIQDDTEDGHRRRQRQPVPTTSQSVAKGKRRAVPLTEERPAPQSPARPPLDSRASAQVVRSQAYDANASPRNSSPESQRTSVSGDSGYASNLSRQFSAQSVSGIAPKYVQQAGSSTGYVGHSSAPPASNISASRAYPEQTQVQQQFRQLHLQPDESSTASSQSTREHVLKQQAQAALKRLLSQGYERAAAEDMIKQQMAAMRTNQRDREEDDSSDEEEQGDSEEEDGDGDENATKDTTIDAAIRARLPGTLKGRHAWRRGDLQSGCEIVQLSSSDVESVQSAVDRFASQSTTYLH